MGSRSGLASSTSVSRRPRTLSSRSPMPQRGQPCSRARQRRPSLSVSLTPSDCRGLGPPPHGTRVRRREQHLPRHRSGYPVFPLGAQTEKRGSRGVVSSHRDRPPRASYPLRRSGLINADAYARRLETSTQLLRRVEASISVTKPLALAPADKHEQRGPGGELLQPANGAVSIGPSRARQPSATEREHARSASGQRLPLGDHGAAALSAPGTGRRWGPVSLSDWRSTRRHALGTGNRCFVARRAAARAIRLGGP